MSELAVQDRVQRVAELVGEYEAWQADAARRAGEGPSRLLALVEAVRAVCLPGGAIDEAAVAALRERTGLSFRTGQGAVLFELADDTNPGKTQTVAVRGAGAGLE